MREYAEPSGVNFACATDTQQVPWVFALLTSGDNPGYVDQATGSAGLEPIQPGLESSAANCQRYTGSAVLRTRSGYPATCAHQIRTVAGQDAFANALTGAYATDPHYGATLIALMRTYDLYRYGLTCLIRSPGQRSAWRLTAALARSGRLARSSPRATRESRG